MNIIKCDKDDLKNLYEGSAWTWEGLNADKENLNAVIKWFMANGAPLKRHEFYVTTGKQMNEFCGGLTGDNAYPDDLTILSIELDNITNVETMFIKKFEVGARWFDDIVDNNRMYNDDYSDDYEDDDGMNY